jgi:hypothetical protein
MDFSYNIVKMNEKSKDYIYAENNDYGDLYKILEGKDSENTYIVESIAYYDKKEERWGKLDRVISVFNPHGYLMLNCNSLKIPSDLNDQLMKESKIEYLTKEEAGIRFFQVFLMV